MSLVLSTTNTSKDELSFDEDLINGKDTSNEKKDSFNRVWNSKLRDQVFQLIEDENNLDLLDFLKWNPEIDLMSLWNEQGFSCLHQASFWGNDSLVKLLLSMARDRSLNGKSEAHKQQAIKAWINTPSKEE